MVHYSCRIETLSTEYLLFSMSNYMLTIAMHDKLTVVFFGLNNNNNNDNVSGLRSTSRRRTKSHTVMLCYVML